MSISNPQQLEIDFSIPAKKSLSVADIAKAMGLSTGKIYAAIDCGQLLGTTIGDSEAEREEWRVPMHNYLAWVANEFPDRLLYDWPTSKWLTVQRTANFLDCSHELIRKHIRNDEFPHTENLGSEKQKFWRIPLFDLIAFVQRRTNAPIC